VTQTNDPTEIGAEPGMGKQLQLQSMSLQSGKEIHEAGPGETLQLQTLAQQPGKGLQESTDPQQQTLILGFIGELSASEIALKLDKQREASLASQVSAVRSLVRYLAPKEDEPILLDRELSFPAIV
jgi:hypothetical protein